MKDVNEDVIDLFNEELSRKQRKEEKKLAKKKAKLKKKQVKKEKKLEEIENIEFAKKIEEKKYNADEIEDNKTINEIPVLKTREKLNEDIIKKRYPFLNFLLGFFIIILLLTSIDYTVYSIIKENNLEKIITSSMLCILSFFYILSIIIKKEGIKKFFQILATVSITAFMCYQLFLI